MVLSYKKELHVKKLALFAILSCAGCGLEYQSAVEPTPKAVEVPPVNPPRVEREWNWGGGSCVHASTVMAFRWSNAMDVAAYWRRTYAGGESYQGLTNKLNRNKIPYYSTGDSNNDVARMAGLGFSEFLGEGNSYGTVFGDVEVLERCSQERRGGVIFYYPNHSILFCGFVGDKAYVLDNNRIEYFIEIPKAEFIRRWKGYGGVCVVPTIGAPRPPIPYIAQR